VKIIFSCVISLIRIKHKGVILNEVSVFISVRNSVCSFVGMGVYLFLCFEVK